MRLRHLAMMFHSSMERNEKTVRRRVLFECARKVRTAQIWKEISALCSQRYAEARCITDAIKCKQDSIIGLITSIVIAIVCAQKLHKE